LKAQQYAIFAEIDQICEEASCHRLVILDGYSSAFNLNISTRKAMTVLSRTLCMTAVAAALAACGSDPAPVSQQAGLFLDSAVEGLDYTAGNEAASITTSSGEFICRVGDPIAFKVGGIALGSAPCASTITPLTLTGVQNVRDSKVGNRLLMLQLLDEDNDPANGIRISSTVRAALAGKSLDFNADPAAFNTGLAALLNGLGAPYSTRSIDDERRTLTREHFEDTLASKTGTPVRETLSQTTALGAVGVTVTRYQLQAASSLHIPYEGQQAGVKADFPLGFLPAYGSGLTFKGTNANGELEFYGITDRGPNGDGPDVPSLSGSGTMDSKIFPAPGFVPSIGLITVGKNGAVLASPMPIKARAGANATGLALPPATLGHSGEVPVFDTMKYEPSGKAAFHADGIDTEAVALDRKRNALWASDEYGPFIVRIDATSGVIQARYAPGSGLPAILAKRRANRGMEGMTLDAETDRIHGFLQSPLTDGSAFYKLTNKNEQVERFARFVRWIEFDPSSVQTARMFAYPLDPADWKDGRTGNAKLGDMVALGGGKFLVIEQGSAPGGKVVNKLMLVQIGNATDIQGPAFNPATSDLEKSSMAASAVNGADWSAVVPLKKTLLLDLNAIGWLAEKAEGVALVDASTIALINDNDFGLMTKVFDASGKPVAGADVTECKVDANGSIITSSAAGCTAGNSIRVARGNDKERPTRLWVIKFDKAIASY
jgi:hypothetical protein